MDSLQINFWVVVLLVVLAVGFDFMNGFHDAANSIATVVSTEEGNSFWARVAKQNAFSTIVSTFTFSSTVAASATAAVAHGMDGRHPVA